MPVWHATTEKWVEDGRLVVLGVAQEQHADRCRLFAQWHGIEFPILHDPINFIGAKAVPIVVAIDEHGIVRSVQPKPEELGDTFVNKTFPDPGLQFPAGASVPDIGALRAWAEEEGTAGSWRAAGHAFALWHAPARLGEAIEAYGRAVEIDPTDGAALFGLGACYSMRHESECRQAGDFQSAVDAWGRALATNPGQYIWRRRIQQYGPRSDKPYPFYDWLEQGRADILARGGSPIDIVTPPTASEVAGPSEAFEISATGDTSPDPDGRIPQDTGSIIESEVTVIPSRAEAGTSSRVHIELWPSRAKKAHWNNEADPLRVWVDPPEHWEVESRLLTVPQPETPISAETRRIEFGVRVPEAAPPGKTSLPAYALYYACEDVDGVCYFLRRDMEIEIEVAPAE